MLRVFFIFLLILFVEISRAAPEDLAFFEQFVYRVEDVGNDPDFPEYSHRFVMAGYVDHPFNRRGNNFHFANISLFLFKDYTYKMVYRENSVEDGEVGFFPVGCKVFAGNWSVPEKKLIIEGVATGGRHFEDHQYKILLRFDNDIFGSGLKDVEFPSGLGFSNYGPEMAFCF